MIVELKVYSTGYFVYCDWKKDGKLHREDGPAVIYADGSKDWCQDDVLHREDGPAVIYSNGRQKAWYTRGLLVRREISGINVT